MVNLYLVRHGECEGSGLYIGRGSDVSLVKKGRDQIRDLSDYLSDELSGQVVHHLYSSSMSRALESSSIISNKMCLSVDSVPGLEEMDFGEWESFSYDELLAKYPVKLRSWIDNPIDNKPPSGESLTQLKCRVDQSLPDFSKMIDRGDVKNIILVSHRGPIAVMLLHFLGLELNKFWNFKIDRGSVSKLALYPRFCELEFLNRKF